MSILKSESGYKFGDKCSFHHTGRFEVQPNEKPKKDVGQVAAAILKDVRLLGCVFQNTEPPGSLPILRKSTKVLGSIRRVRFTKVMQPSEKTKVRRSEIQVESSSSAQFVRFLHFEARSHSSGD